MFIGSKLLKLKKYIKALGGAKDAAYLVYMYFRYGEVPPNLGKNLWDSVTGLASMILGIDEVQNQCGHLFN